MLKAASRTEFYFREGGAYALFAIELTGDKLYHCGRWLSAALKFLHEIAGQL